jgi:hypothetical protein
MRAALLACVLAGTLACGEEVVPTTQIVVVVDAEPALAASITHLELFARRDGTMHREDIVLDADTTLPLSFSLVPGLDMPEGELEVRALDAGGSVLGQRTLRVTFVARRTLGYGILFSTRCKALLGLCDAPDDTCVDCACGPAEVPPDDLTPLRHADDVFDAWLPRLRCEAPQADAGT